MLAKGLGESYAFLSFKRENHVSALMQTEANIELNRVSIFQGCHGTQEHILQMANSVGPNLAVNINHNSILVPLGQMSPYLKCAGSADLGPSNQGHKSHEGEVARRDSDNTKEDT